ncbi:MAG: GtrA family protein [Parcubacteria group bacterium Gr01-1014_46]|nr:MAG: GtrA family protein [Parcubacteria group bacterium Gr01-1014_46]
MPKEYMDKYISLFFEITSRYVGLRYFISGSTAGVTDIAVLYILNTILGIYYLISAILAFLVAFFVSFLLHKFWTFKSHEEATHRQMAIYLLTSLFGLSLNTILMYIFVDHIHVQVILSQIIVGLLVACVSFFISRNFVFKYKPENNILQ